MSTGKREKPKYPGVYFRVDTSTKEKTYYIRYRLGGRDSEEVEEPVGKSTAGMTEAKASILRGDRMRGKALPNTERRAAKRATKEAEASRWTISKLWAEYKSTKTINL